MKKWVWGIVFLASASFAMDKPGGLTRTAVNNPVGFYEVLLSPSVTLNPGGAYLSSELRIQHSEDVGYGFGFGAGEVGYNLGGNVIWHIFPDTKGQPAVALMGGVYLNELAGSYLVIRATPIVSKAFPTSFGQVTPYGAMNLAPSIELSGGNGGFAMKASAGVEFAVKTWGGLKVWAELGIGISKSPHEMVGGISYPFETLGS